MNLTSLPALLRETLQPLVENHRPRGFRVVIHPHADGQITIRIDYLTSDSPRFDVMAEVAGLAESARAALESGLLPLGCTQSPPTMPADHVVEWIVHTPGKLL